MSEDDQEKASVSLTSDFAIAIAQAILWTFKFYAMRFYLIHCSLIDADMRLVILEQCFKALASDTCPWFMILASSKLKKKHQAKTTRHTCSS